VRWMWAIGDGDDKSGRVWVVWEEAMLSRLLVLPVPFVSRRDWGWEDIDKCLERPVNPAPDLGCVDDER